MSTEQGQSGDWIFNKTNFPKISKLIRDNINLYHLYCFEVSVVIYNELKENKIKKNKESARDFINKKMIGSRYISGYGYTDCVDPHKLKGYSLIKNKLSITLESEILEQALNEIFRNNNNTLLKPRKIAFPKIKNTEKSFSIDFDDVRILVSDTTNSVSWIIDVSNHANDHAYDTFYPNLLFPIIRKHKWAKKESGVLITKVENFSDCYDSPDYDYDYQHYGQTSK